MELRAFIEDVQSVEDSLLNLGAEYRGDYNFTDRLYDKSDPELNSDFNSDFVRIRCYSKSKWNHKPYVLVRKTTTWQSGVRITKEVNHNEYDTIEEAESAIPSDLNCILSFAKSGKHYVMKGVNCHIKFIDYILPSIEITGDDALVIRNLLNSLPIKEIAKAPVPQLVLENKWRSGWERNH